MEGRMDRMDDEKNRAAAFAHQENKRLEALSSYFILD